MKLDIKATLKEAGYKPKQIECIVRMIGDEEIYESEIKYLRYGAVNVCDGINIYDLMQDLRDNAVEVKATSEDSESKTPKKTRGKQKKLTDPKEKYEVKSELKNPISKESLTDE